MYFHFVGGKNNPLLQHFEQVLITVLYSAKHKTMALTSLTRKIISVRCKGQLLSQWEGGIQWIFSSTASLRRSWKNLHFMGEKEPSTSKPSLLSKAAGSF